ncbi:hypothetical protein TruAng_009331 [Truncatella angustata]|nr:hypothetical protein TruAng_009331 [Truncatella angustata]
MLVLTLSLVAHLATASCTTNVSEIPVTTLSEGALCACHQLSNTYGNLTLFGNSSGYVERSTDFWDIRSDLLPECIFLPNDKDQVAHAVSTFASCGAQFAMRGGGHMNFPGSNNIDGGVLLALSNLNTVKVSQDNSTVEVGPGNRWVDVYEALSPHGLYTVGGRLKTIGVAGLELIGGFHYFNNKYGMAMDNVVSYDVVLGNGTQVVANSTSNPDLFWALKGGANNFGVVTKFTLKTYPIPLVSTTAQIHNESAVPDFIAATTAFARHDDPDIAAGAVINISLNFTTGALTTLLLGVQESTESPPSKFADFSDIPAISSTSAVLPPVEWHSQFETPNQMVQFAHRTMKPDTEQLQRIYQDWRSKIEILSDVEGLFATFVMNPLPKSALSVAKNNGVGNVWGLDDDESWILWQVVNTWDNAKDDLRVTNFARSFIDYWHQDNQDKGLSSEFIYMGDAAEFQDPFPGMPLKNVNRMKSIRAAYDPLGTFTRLNWGGFKLSP